MDQSTLLEAQAVLHQLTEAHKLRERTPDEIQRKIEHCERLSWDVRINRVRLMREVARLEEKRGNDLVACAYRLRIMRWLGGDIHGDLAWVKNALIKHGYPRETVVAEAMFASEPDRDERCRAILDTALEKHRHGPALPEFELVHDCRPADHPRVAVIVSLYNAATKLPRFLHALQCQTLLRRGQVELIFIDSHSPAAEFEALRNTTLQTELPYVFARTAERETIQTAWNRGIALARAPYMTCLGVDETMTPDALEILAGELDANPAIDWVQGDSIVTDVDKNGVYVRDVLHYDRSGYTQDHVSMDTCYLNWVGALYRRSIHERFGYYDGSFRAAGDTEFKMRVLPFIQTKYIPRMLGVFWNYPEERMTTSPRAELEDLRAWYLHRTPAGVRYAYQGREPIAPEGRLLLALHHRKAHMRHASTDVEYALHLVNFLAEQAPASPTTCLARGIAALLNAYRSLDSVPTLDPRRFAEIVAQARAAITSVQADHRGAPWLQKAEYEAFHDNRYEQHVNFW